MGSRTLRLLGVRGLSTLEPLSIAFAIGLVDFDLGIFLAGLLPL